MPEPDNFPHKSDRDMFNRSDVDGCTYIPTSDEDSAVRALLHRLRLPFLEYNDEFAFTMRLEPIRPGQTWMLTVHDASYPREER